MNTRWSAASGSFALVSYSDDRWYEAGTGRYTRPDPLGLRSGINLFSYVGARPLRFTDPLGLYVIEDFTDYQTGPGVTIPGKWDVDYSCCCCTGGWCSSFRLGLNFTLYSPAGDDCTLGHEQGHINVATQHVMGVADPILIPVEDTTFGTREACENASKAAQEEFGRKAQRSYPWLEFKQEVLYEWNPFIRCGR